MLLDIDHHSGVPIYRQVVDQVRDQIMAGRLLEGDQLMSVREASAALRVNPMTVSKAYSALEAEGLLERRRGIGLFVARIQSRKKEQSKEAAMEAILAKAVATAVQYGVSETQMRQMIKTLYSNYQSE
ncbi:MAG: GntR family transcriptional regulator [Phycisphaeraceae bacterium]|nr:GntR family transcriptional regulator [Phycisphaeraceae bacterium]